MDKKFYYLGTVLLLIYVLLFIVITQQKPHIIKEQLNPYIFHAICEEDDKPLLFLDNGRTICRSESTLYTKIEGKKRKINDIPQGVNYISSSRNLLIHIKDKTIFIETISDSLEILAVTSYTIPRTSSFVSTFITTDINENTIVFISMEKTAIAITDDKSEIVRITIFPDKKSKIDSYLLKSMLKVTDYLQESDSIYLIEMHPFLLSKNVILQWQSKKQLNIVESKNEELHDTRLRLAEWADERLTFDTETSELWYTNEVHDINYLVAVAPHANTWELTAKYSTRKDKRVYNCFDFSESSQITLRTCIPKL